MYPAFFRSFFGCSVLEFVSMLRKISQTEANEQLEIVLKRPAFAEASSGRRGGRIFYGTPQPPRPP